MKPFTLVSMLLFAVVSLSHLLRILLGWQMTVEGVSIPVWASVLGVVVPGLLAVMLWRESRG